ncbi:hypothetical protein [Hyphococcus sp. DH-69]|uniref:hypothetical protein n=1 Tax=Hyphococcus formosus TaxID=3143534 RepID=UPI00398B134A
MAITHPNDFADHSVSFGPKAKTALFYILVAIIAMAVAIPAAITFGNAPVLS